MPFLSIPLSRIYTPPTCTLEVTAQPSALSRWTRTPAIKSLEFLLSLDGLQPNRREPLELRGNQTQLAALSEAVSDYIQHLLAHRHTDLPLSPLSSAAPLVAPPFSAEPSHPLQLRPCSLLTHELILGDLATDYSGPSVILKVSQLYDLATALEDCAADLQQVPSLSAAPVSWRTTLLPTVRSAAMVLFAVGLGTATWRLLQSGPITMNSAGRSPSSETAMAPVTPSVANKPFPSGQKTVSSPLVLPQVKLPTRSSTPFPQPPTQSSQNGKDRLEVVGASRQSTPPAAGSLQSLPPEPEPQPPQEIALAPAPVAPSSSTEKGLQQADTAAPAPASATAGMGTMRNTMSNNEFSPLSKAMPGNVRSQSTLFDTVPQVAEVRDYVASRWQPAPPPPQALEYRVTINANGSLAKVEPLGTSARQYLAQLPLPTDAAPFVSPLESGASPSIRLVLRQDGTVQTFLDASVP